MEETRVYMASGDNIKKYHRVSEDYRFISNDIFYSICSWPLNKKTKKKLSEVDKDLLCKVCFKKYLKQKEEERSFTPVNNRFELLDL